MGCLEVIVWGCRKESWTERKTWEQLAMKAKKQEQIRPPKHGSKTGPGTSEEWAEKEGPAKKTEKK